MNSEYIPSRQSALKHVGRTRAQRQLRVLSLPVCPKSLALLFRLTTRADTVTAGSSLGANKAMFDLFGTKRGKDPFKLGKQVSRRRAPRDQKQNKKMRQWLFKQLVFFSWQAWTTFLSVSIKKKTDPSTLACSLYWPSTTCWAATWLTMTR